MSPPNIQNSNFAKTPKMSLFEPKQPIVLWLGTILILRNQKDWVGGVSKMIMLHIKWAPFTNDDWLQTGWVGFKMVKILIT